MGKWKGTPRERPGSVSQDRVQEHSICFFARVSLGCSGSLDMSVLLTALYPPHLRKADMFMCLPGTGGKAGERTWDKVAQMSPQYPPPQSCGLCEEEEAAMGMERSPVESGSRTKSTSAEICGSNVILLLQVPWDPPLVDRILPQTLM